MRIDHKDDSRPALMNWDNLKKIHFPFVLYHVGRALEINQYKAPQGILSDKQRTERLLSAKRRAINSLVLTKLEGVIYL